MQDLVASAARGVGVALPPDACVSGRRCMRNCKRGGRPEGQSAGNPRSDVRVFEPRRKGEGKAMLMLDRYDSRFGLCAPKVDVETFLATLRRLPNGRADGKARGT